MDVRGSDAPGDGCNSQSGGPGVTFERFICLEASTSASQESNLAGGQLAEGAQPNGAAHGYARLGRAGDGRNGTGDH